jgi:hypothetical protein
MPEVFDRVQPIVAVASGWRIWRVVVRTSNNANRKAILPTKRESPVTAGERLIVNLLTGVRISASVSSVNEHIPVISVIFVPARENDRLCALHLAARDARLGWYMNSALVEFCAVLEEASFGITGYVSEEPFRHADAYRIRFLRRYECPTLA